MNRRRRPSRPLRPGLRHDARRRCRSAVPQLVLCLLATATLAHANDPTGDLLRDAVGDPNALDLVALGLRTTSSPSGGALDIDLTFSSAVGPALLDGSGLHGFVDLDTDRDPATGQRSAGDFLTLGSAPGLAAGIGSDLQIALASWSADDSAVDLIDQATAEVVARVPLEINGSTVSLHLAPALLPQPVAVHVQAAVGSGRAASDVAPNGGWVTSTAASAEGVPLHGGRFRVEVEWTDFDGNQGTGTPVTTSNDSVLFWFFDAGNWELLVKVLDACGINDSWWVFAGATTNVAYTLRITDTQTGTVRVYGNPLGTSPVSLNDVDAFAVCP